MNDWRRNHARKAIRDAMAGEPRQLRPPREPVYTYPPVPLVVRWGDPDGPAGQV